MDTIPKLRNSYGELRNYSMIPLFIGGLGLIGCWVAPSQLINQIWWAPLLLDPGCALLALTMIFLAVTHLSKRIVGPKHNG